MPRSYLVLKSGFDYVTSDKAPKTKNICLQVRTAGNHNSDNFPHLDLNLGLLLKADANSSRDDIIKRLQAKWSEKSGNRRHLLSECALPGENR